MAAGSSSLTIMIELLPRILTVSLLCLALWLGWRAYCQSPLRLRQIRPYRQSRGALVVLTAREGHLAQSIAQVEAHIEAAMALGLPVITVQQTESLIMSVVSSLLGRHPHGEANAEGHLLMFTVSSEDAFDNAAFEALLVALQVSELYILSANPAFPPEPTVCSARARGYETRTLRPAAASQPARAEARGLGGYQASPR
ncbi:hypothetical protein [Uliginosibacterium sp. 31-12]|uniref:hypothetical protein n=1 Tax=Uliginosibacterium sp. 31-12 TaxID=3062781 RepID=UPI0026E48731|nr:hypothetical protein [Uliginosibacterium sp. 31-12]MDO6386323.1 hypothetical protein [Uliginosibacterium sp. 31-12]